MISAINADDIRTGEAAEPPAPTEVVAPGSEPAAPGEPAQADELRQRLNIFEDGALQFDQPQE